APAPLRSGGGHHRADRDRHVGEEVRRLPADVVDLANRLRGKFRRGGGYEGVDPRALQAYDLRVDGGIADLVGDFLDDHGRVFAAERVLEADEGVLAESVVLVEHADLGA